MTSPIYDGSPGDGEDALAALLDIDLGRPLTPDLAVQFAITALRPVAALAKAIGPGFDPSRVHPDSTPAYGYNGVVLTLGDLRRAEILHQMLVEVHQDGWPQISTQPELEKEGSIEA